MEYLAILRACKQLINYMLIAGKTLHVNLIFLAENASIFSGDALPQDTITHTQECVRL